MVQQPQQQQGQKQELGEGRVQAGEMGKDEGARLSQGAALGQGREEVVVTERESSGSGSGASRADVPSAGADHPGEHGGSTGTLASGGAVQGAPGASGRMPQG